MRSELGGPRLDADAGSLFGLTHTGVAVCRDGGGVTACDANYAAILGRAPAEVLGLQMADVTHPEDVDLNAWLLCAAKAGGRSFDIRKGYVLPNGDVQWVENRIIAVAPGSGGLLILMSRPIEPPLTSPRDDAVRDYIEDVSAQLAVMARNAGLVRTAEALDLAALISEVERGP